MSIEIDLQYAADKNAALQLPEAEKTERWVNAVLKGRRDEAQLTVRIVDEEESRMLNETYRHQKGPTNVLSFPFEPQEHLALPLLGDVVICAQVVAREAREQNKQVEAHWAHMVVHGVLHLLGYDHLHPEQADKMEAVEIGILDQLGFPDPYAG